MQSLNSRKLVICYVRHGQTFDNIDGIIAGHKPGKLTKVGIQQAHQIGTVLKDAVFDYIYVSDLNRTRETYEGIIQKAKPLSEIKAQFTPLIRQKCGGILEGKKSTIWMENANKEKVHIRNYKCTKSQSWKDVYDRSNKFLHQLIKTHLSPQIQIVKQIEELNLDDKKEKKAIKILVVTHGGFIMETHNLMGWIESKKEPVFSNTAKNCSFHEFQVGYKGKNFQEINNEEIEVKCLKKNITHY